MLGVGTLGVLGQKPFAVGGTVTTISGFRVHSFTSVGNTSVSTFGNLATPSLEYLVVAGGGGGSGGNSGGGGAGGFRTSVPGAISGRNTTAEPVLPVSASTFTVTVGGGGGANANGGNSVFQNIVSTGGGRGAGGSNSLGGTGGNGGCGGAGGLNGGRGFGTAAQGFDGGVGLTDRENFNSHAGGGGAAGAGQNGSNFGGARPGGPGRASSITGSAVTRSKGGDAQSNATGPANSGNGGGGNARAGGSGIIVIRFPQELL